MRSGGNQVFRYREVVLLFQVWQMAENIYNDEEPETPASELESGAS